VWVMIVSFFIFSTIIAILITLRWRGEDKYDLRNTDVFLALVFAIFFVVIFEKYSRISFSGFELERVYEKVTSAPINIEASTLNNIPFDSLQKIEDAASNNSNIPPYENLGSQYESVSLVLGINKLKPRDLMTICMNISYIVLNRQDGTFWGLVELTQAYKNMEIGFTRFTLALTESDTLILSQAKNFISHESALTPTASNTDALMIMDSLGTDILPIVNNNRGFIGITARDNITSSLILDLMKALKN
jgi:hypothetical protein